MVNISSQTNYQDAQNFDLDIEKIYTDFIIIIDKIRSYTNTSSISAQDTINIFQSPDTALSTLRTRSSTESSLQESRCHAFFRIIGFPVVSNANKIYNPGLDIIYDSQRKINLKSKLSIAATLIDKFRDLSLLRENYVININSLFSLSNTIDASVLALSSGTQIRQFASPVIINSEPFDMDSKNQQYKINIDSLVGKNTKKLTEYVDINGNTPTKLSTQRIHLIKPFIVDPVIDFTVNDATKLIAIPFVFNRSQLMIKDDIFVNRPILEQVIRDRFIVVNQQNNLGTADQSIINYIKSIPAVQNEAIINRINSGDVYQLSEQTQFVKFINIIRSMMKKLVEAQLIISNIQSKYYWLPIPALNGPEGGSKVQGVLLSTKIPNDFITSREKSIIDAKIRVTVNQINAQTDNVQGVPDIGGFAFDNFKTTFGPDTSSALGDNSSQVLQDLTNKRISDLQKANDALRTIEIIMGEFSGLGLCDIIAIMGALYIMPKQDLLGFLDDDAIIRMNTLLKLNESSPGIQSSMISFVSTVKDFYNLMDKIYQDLSQNNGFI